MVVKFLTNHLGLSTDVFVFIVIFLLFRSGHSCGLVSYLLYRRTVFSRTTFSGFFGRVKGLLLRRRVFVICWTGSGMLIKTILIFFFISNDQGLVDEKDSFVPEIIKFLFFHKQNINQKVVSSPKKSYTLFTPIILI